MRTCSWESPETGKLFFQASNDGSSWHFQLKLDDENTMQPSFWQQKESLNKLALCVIFNDRESTNSQQLDRAAAASLYKYKIL